MAAATKTTRTATPAAMRRRRSAGADAIAHIQIKRSIRGAAHAGDIVLGGAPNRPLTREAQPVDYADVFVIRERCE